MASCVTERLLVQLLAISFILVKDLFDKHLLRLEGADFDAGCPQPTP